MSTDGGSDNDRTEEQTTDGGEGVVEPRPGKIAYPIWNALNSLSKTTTTLHTLDGEYPGVTAMDLEKDLEQAQQSIDSAVEMIEEYKSNHPGIDTEDDQKMSCIIGHCDRSVDSGQVCNHHQIRKELADVSVGDEVFVNNYGAFLVRKKTEYADRRGQYQDTFFQLVGNRDDGSVWYLKVFCNDSGEWGTGRPTYCTVDADGNRDSGATHITKFRVVDPAER